MDQNEKDLWKELRVRRQERNLKRLHSSTQTLVDKKIHFASKNFGQHLIIKQNRTVVDFWPSTGKFKIRGENRCHTGINLLIKKLGHKEKA